ncbi:MULTISPECIES: hypothetical protein [unclassified Synechococcus]|nr:MULTISPECIES: hypothetical protein [unclassified Synechococcus]
MFSGPDRDHQQLADLLTPFDEPLPFDNLVPIAAAMLQVAIQAQGGSVSDLKLQRLALAALFELGIEHVEAAALEEAVNEAFQQMKARATSPAEVSA